MRGTLRNCHRPRRSEECGFALRGGRQRSRWRGAQYKDLRGCDRRSPRGFRGSSLWPTRVVSTRRQIGVGVPSRILPPIKLPESSV
ncbi:hypothetical protein STEG23_006352 [Scotinomys teguina]